MGTRCVGGSWFSLAAAALTAACGAQDPSSQTGALVATDVETKAAPPLLASAASSGTEAAAEAGCPPMGSVGVVVDLSGMLRQKKPRLAWVEPQPETRPIVNDAGDATTEVDLGKSPRRDAVWVFADATQSACKVQATRDLAILGAEPWEKNVLVVTELTGSCDLTKGARLAVQQRDEPEGCALVSPSTVHGAAIVDTQAAPAALRAAFAASSCGAPCDFKREIRGARASASGRGLEWSVAAHIHVDPSEQECMWKHDDFLQLLARSETGTVTVHETQGLDEVFMEGGDIVGFVDRGLGSLTTYRWPRGTAPRQVTTIEHGWSHDEDNEELSLSPYCGP